MTPGRTAVFKNQEGVQENMLPCLTYPACGGFEYVRMLGQAETMNLQGDKAD